MDFVSIVPAESVQVMEISHGSSVSEVLLEKETVNVVPADFVTFRDQEPPEAILVSIEVEDRASTALAIGIINDVIVAMTKSIANIFFRTFFFIKSHIYCSDFFFIGVPIAMVAHYKLCIGLSAFL